MKITDVISARGVRDVVTISPASTLNDLLTTLAENRIGAVVVSGDGSAVDGIISERDVVRALHKDGPDVLGNPVSTHMTTQVVTCEPRADLSAIASLMTERRFRHIPVVEDGRLIGIISIGDAVKARISQVEAERDHLMDYIHQ